MRTEGLFLKNGGAFDSEKKVEFLMFPCVSQRIIASCHQHSPEVTLDETEQDTIIEYNF